MPLFFLGMFILWGAIAWTCQTMRARQRIEAKSHLGDGDDDPAVIEKFALKYLADRRQTRNRIIAVAAHIQIIGLFVPTAIAALSPLDCTKQPSGEITLDASPDMLCSAEEEGYSTLAALSPFLFILFAVLPIGGIVWLLYGSRRDLGYQEKVLGCCSVQWGGTESEIRLKQIELNDILKGIRKQNIDVAGSEAGSMIRRAAEKRIKKVRKELAKLQRDEKLFEHPVFQERYGWAFAKYIDSKYYWEIVVLVRKMAIGVIVSFFSYPLFLLLLRALLFSYCFFSLLGPPYLFFPRLRLPYTYTFIDLSFIPCPWYFYFFR